MRFLSFPAICLTVRDLYCRPTRFRARYRITRMPSRLVAFLLSFVLLCLGLNAHASPSAQALAMPVGTHASVADSAPSPLEDSRVADEHHFGGLPSPADLTEHAVLPPALGLSRAHLSMSLSRRTGMADVGSAFIDALLRPPSGRPFLR